MVCVRLTNIALSMAISLLISSTSLAKSIENKAASDNAQKRTVGQTANIQVLNKNGIYKSHLSYLSRVDTGAAVTSLHAIQIQNPSKSDHLHDSIGQMISFKTCNESNQCQSFDKKVVDIVRVRNAQGIEERYVIEMDLVWNDFAKRVKVNLRDRSKMNYKLLLGRNWMKHDIVVDVDQNEGIIE